MQMHQMLAREAIRFTIELYNRNADTADYERHRDVFHPEAVMEVAGTSSGRLEGVDAIITAIKAGAKKRGAFEPGNFQRHNITSTMIDLIDDDRATARIYVIVITEKGLDHAGGYEDEYRRVGERWLIYRRRASLEWANPESRFLKWISPAKPDDRAR